MPDWLQFSLLDMTPYDRLGWLWLVENYQQNYLYLPLLHIVLLAVLLLRPVPHAPRWTLVLLAVNWFWCGGMFQLQYHATVNWAAPQIGWAFIVQGGLLMLGAIFGKTLSWRSLSNSASWPGLLVLLAALFYPLLCWFEGRDFLQWEWFGLMPAPLTFATLGVLMLCVGWWRWALVPIPLVWVVVSAAFTLKLGLLEPYLSGLILLTFLLYSFFSRNNKVD